MIVCVDAYYHPSHHNDEQNTVTNEKPGGTVAALIFQHWQDSTPLETLRMSLPLQPAYVPGQFFKRELQPIMKILSQVSQPISACVIDAYCHLDHDRSPGLGQLLADAVPSIPLIIGVAKNRFRHSCHAVELYRGISQRPLFVTSVGMPYREAADLIHSMAGAHRIPTLLKSVDQLTRQVSS